MHSLNGHIGPLPSPQHNITQLMFCGPSYYNFRMLVKLRRETHIQIELLASHCYILKAHVAEECYEYVDY